MLEIVVPEFEEFDSDTGAFIYWKEQKLILEHSLMSLYQWESKHHKPFLSSSKTDDEILDYIRCMTISRNVDIRTYAHITAANVRAINEYISDPMTATWFKDEPGQKKANKEVVTAEIIYYWMISFNIPFECEKWHINKLLTLIHVCSEKNKPKKKMNKKDMLSQRKALNEARRAKYHSTG